MNVCHNDGTGVTQQSNPLWNAAPLACVNCHQDGAAMITNAHNEHTQYTNMLCTDCHAAATAATHINGSTNLAAAGDVLEGRLVPERRDGGGTCTTSACHNRSVASVAWDQAALACTSCHGNGSGQSMSGSHDPHLVFGKVCNDCHAAAADTTHISTRPANLTNSANAHDGRGGRGARGGDLDEPELPVLGGDGVLGCHATGNADWGTPASADACIECHTNNTTTEVNPTTGLHNSATPPSVSGKVHDETITGGCEACHTATPSSAHQNGVLVSNDANLTGTAITTWDDALKTCVTNATCHTTNSAAWAHKWNYPATTGTGASNACAGCHGDWDNGWNAGVTHRTTAGTRSTHGDQGTSYDCYECHVLESAAYAFTFSTNDWRLTAGRASTATARSRSTRTRTACRRRCIFRAPTTAPRGRTTAAPAATPATTSATRCPTPRGRSRRR